MCCFLKLFQAITGPAILSPFQHFTTKQTYLLLLHLSVSSCCSGFGADSLWIHCFFLQGLGLCEATVEYRSREGEPKSREEKHGSREGEHRSRESTGGKGYWHKMVTVRIKNKKPALCYLKVGDSTENDP